MIKERLRSTEDSVLKDCLGYLSLTGIYHWRNNTGAVKTGGRFVRFGFKGSADILGICPDGRFLSIECKRTKGGKISKEQQDFYNNIKKNGGVAMFCNSLESMISQLKENNVI